MEREASERFPHSRTKAANVSTEPINTGPPVRTLILRSALGQTARVHRQTLIDRSTLGALRRSYEALLAGLGTADFRAPCDAAVVAPAGVAAIRIGDSCEATRVRDSVDQTSRFGAPDITGFFTGPHCRESVLVPLTAPIHGGLTTTRLGIVKVHGDCCLTGTPVEGKLADGWTPAESAHATFPGAPR